MTEEKLTPTAKIALDDFKAEIMKLKDALNEFQSQLDKFKTALLVTLFIFIVFAIVIVFAIL